MDCEMDMTEKRYGDEDGKVKASVSHCYFVGMFFCSGCLVRYGYCRMAFESVFLITTTAS